MASHSRAWHGGAASRCKATTLLAHHQRVNGSRGSAIALWVPMPAASLVNQSLQAAAIDASASASAREGAPLLDLGCE